ncbi:uncharacterized protein ALTATR162_LOCUS3841 [Alternaria atra]|uniref:Uncharacterized protein n=1 Tax=Alternaria atra TaxID=119953 RepID=A0A8J2HXC1_9PLEO|nr:uncharacterized protein ALTATR162_LOCUS3841 [Alternaria atra]CAG5155800.1 unnamed protein product [Alternaria atra]
MPFRDQEWEDLQRDYDIFPAYSDYIYGADGRLVVTQEPGLHPMIYPRDISAPIRYTNSMPSRSWSHKTAEGLEKSNKAATQTLAAGQDEIGDSDSDISGTNNGSSTPGLDVRSQTGSPLNPLLPPQGVHTVSEKEMARRKTLNASQRRPRSRIVVPFSPLQQQQSVRLTKQQTQTRNTSVARRPEGQPHQPSLLRSPSTTDIDENPAPRALLQKRGMLSPFASPAPMLDPPANLSQQQPQRATDLPNNFPLPSTPNDPPKSSHEIPPLQANDILHNPRYDYLHSDKRMQIAKILVDRWVVVRESPPHSALRAKAILDIRNVTMMVNKSVPNLQAVTELQKQRAQQLKTQAALEVQTLQVNQIQQPQQISQAPQVYIQPRLQPDVSSPQPTQLSPSQPLQQPAPREPYYSIPQPAHQMQLPQQYTPEGYQAHSQAQQQTHQRYQQSPNQNLNLNPTQPQASALLRANINRHIPQVWQCLQIARNPPQTAQNKEHANQWLGQFRNSLSVEGREYFMQVMQRALLEQRQGRDALAFLGLHDWTT